MQVLLNILRGFTAQAALDAPRFCISAGMPDALAANNAHGAAGSPNSEVFFEEGISLEIVQALRGEVAIALHVIYSPCSSRLPQTWDMTLIPSLVLEDLCWVAVKSFKRYEMLLEGPFGQQDRTLVQMVMRQHRSEQSRVHSAVDMTRININMCDFLGRGFLHSTLTFASN